MSMASATGENVRKILAIQEQRQAQYQVLKKAHEKYVSQEWTLQQYQTTITEVTTTFQSLSQEVLHLIEHFESSDLKEVVRILKELQKAEKDKLEGTVKWQLVSQQDGESEREVEDFGAALHEKRELKKKLAAVEGSIAELIQDLRYECEPFLLTNS